MADGNMYGVVLWSDESEEKAVIWCEDHGNLAFYTQSDQSGSTHMTLDAGDLIQFDVSEVCQMRYARNLRLIGQEQYPAIAEQLASACKRPSMGAGGVHQASNSNVIDVNLRRRA